MPAAQIGYGLIGAPRCSTCASDTPGSRFFLVPSVLGLVVLSGVAVALGSALAALGALVFLTARVYLARILWRRRQVPLQRVVQGGRRGATALFLPAFVTFARHSEGAWTQRGAVVVGEACALFLPMGGPSHLALDVLLALAGPTLRFADIAVDVGGTTPTLWRTPPSATEAS